MEGNLKIFIFKTGGFILYWFSENVYSSQQFEFNCSGFYQINIMLIEYLVLSLELHILFSFLLF